MLSILSSCFLKSSPLRHDTVCAEPQASFRTVMPGSSPFNAAAFIEAISGTQGGVIA